MKRTFTLLFTLLILGLSLASQAQITGTTSVCVGSTNTLSASPTGGTWSSVTTSVATVGASSGTVYGVSSGTSIISYNTGTGWLTTTVSVNPTPAAIAGASTVCVGATTTLTDATGGGAWSSSATSTATVSGGVVTGVSGGSVTITYSLGSCYAVKGVSVNINPAPIAGDTTICGGYAVTMTDATGGGTWFSGSAGVIVTTAGVVTGYTPGTATITYKVTATGCYATRSVTVNLCSFCPDNIDFEMGSLSNWTFFRGFCTALAPVYTWNMTATAPVPTLHSLMSTGTDAYGGFPVVDALGGAFACKIGKDSSQYNCDGARYYIHVPIGSTVYSLIYKYATVLEDPTGHTLANKPRFEINTYDSATGAAVPCTAYGFQATSTIPGFFNVPATDIYYKSWTSGNMKFPGMGGRTVAIDFKVGGCSQSGHWGYAYIDMSCGLFAIYYVSCGGSTATLSAPSGYASYSWKDSATFATSYGSTQVVTITVPTVTTVYAVICIPYTGYGGCPDTLYTKVVPSNLVTHRPRDTSICSGFTVRLTDSASDILPMTFTWAPSAGVSCTTCDPVFVTPTVTTTYSVTVRDAGGCVHLDTVTVTVVPTPTAILGSTAVCLGLTTTLSDGVTGGRWTSGTPSVASINSTSGLVQGVSVGTSNITYSMGGGLCNAYTVVTVNPLPATITGSTSVCVGLTTTLSDGTGGGTWSSGSPLVATVGTSSGVVTGVASGTSIITYRLSATGCITTTVVTVNPLPNPISGITTICSGATTTLSDLGGGTWSSSNGAVASINVATGVVTGVGAFGTAIITYKLATSCIITTTVTINPNPATISGTLNACEGGGLSTLTDATGGGTWSSSFTSVATVGTSSGVVTGILAGTTMITYMLSSTSCYTTAVFTVNPAPVPITGATTLCLGSTTALTDLTPGGTWSSSNGTIATPNPVTGATYANSLGFATITYTLPTSCYITTLVNVAPLPAVVTGPTTVCVGSTITEADATPGGTWASSNTTCVPILPTAGLVTGICVGTAVIDYSLSTGCFRSTTITVNPAPSPITGVTSVCPGTCTTLSNAVGGGVWSSSATTVTVGSSTGIVCGVTSGTAKITYSVTGCTVTANVTISPAPSVPSGATAVCVGSCITLTSTPAGGTWSSSVTSVGTVGTGGTVCGVSLGSTVITYMLSTGCYNTQTVNISSTPSPLTPFRICTGVCTTLTNSVGGGLWTSSAPAVLTLGSTTGLACGVTAGTAIVTYSLGSGCRVTTVATVTLSPNALTGPTTTCIATCITLASTTGGGVWSSSATSVATVAGGVTCGASAGTTTISYTLASGCAAVSTITVNPTPATITGLTSACVGACNTLANSVGSGAWSSSNPAVATISGGTYCGVSAGTSLITYAIGTCRVTAVVTIYAVPSVISGSSAVCMASCITLTNTVGGGTWSSSLPTVATANSTSGLVCGVTMGSAVITYKLPGGCYTTTTITVTPTPSSITGPSTICAGFCVTESDAVLGGLWSSSNPAVANANSTTGSVCGVTVGTAIISYSLGTGCLATKTVAVISSPAAISGPSTLCVGSCSSYTDATSGGVWSSSSSATATVSSTGFVCGVSAGTVDISYTMPSGCYAVKTITVNPVPSAIAGSTSICVGQCTTLTATGPGGTWSSSAGTIATVSGGVVCGVASGTTVITYTLGGCYSTVTVTVTLSPTAIGGSTGVGIGSTSTLTDGVPTGTWSSSVSGVASIDPTSGVVTGITLGTTMITYMLPSGCYTTTVVNVSTWCGTCTIAGGNICTGNCETLTFAVSGGTWSTTAPSIATINSITGAMCGLAPGTATITYTTGSCCITSRTFTVFPSPGPISGPSTLCVGQCATYTDLTPGGVWSSSSPAVATLNPVTHNLCGVTAGTTTLSYTLGGTCAATMIVMVNPTPGTITGPATVCANDQTEIYTNPITVTWSSSATSVATIDATAGDFHPASVSGGTTVITATSGTCTRTTTVVVNPIAPITGSPNICIGTCTTLADAIPSGTWSSSSTGIATVSGGVVCGGTAGTVVITYAMATGCTATKAITVNSLPAVVSGPSNMCIGSCVLIVDASPGGTWSSSNVSVGTIDAGGNSCGVAAGTVVITYSLGSGCIATKSLTVNGLPGVITGSFNICQSSTTTLSSLPGGGTWSSLDPDVLVGSATGLVTGLSVGTAEITYTSTLGCSRTAIVTVNGLPAAIAGATQICAGSCTTLSDATGGGTWSATPSSVATLSSGVLCGAAPGVATIVYTLATSCRATLNVTVTPVPSVIGGATNVCVGSSATLTNLIPGGTWYSSNSSIAAINPSTGVINGISSGTVLVSYSLASGCMQVIPFIVNPIAPITGPTSVCQLQTIVLADTALGGSWTASSGIVTVTGISGGLGVVYGASPGVVTVSYTLPTGCYATSRIVVNAIPPAISGPLSVCEGQSVVLSDSRLGGTWSSTTPTVASITGTTLSPSTVTLFGVSRGSSLISYTISGCPATLTLTVNPLPDPIAGAGQVCVGATTMLTDGVPGGSWTSSNPAIATADLISGLVGGVSSGSSVGTATITYTIGTGCAVTKVMSVYPNPSVITGPSNICVSSCVTMSNPTPGGSWNSNNNAVASIDVATGRMCGVAPGFAIISYTLPSGCFATTLVVVNSLPPAIVGASDICKGSCATYTDPATGGRWSTTTPTVVTVDTMSGMVCGTAAGTANIVYTIGTGCNTSITVNVNPLPDTITGARITCIDGNTTLSDLTGGGTWSTLDTALTIDATGLVTGMYAGFATVTYSIPPMGCAVTAIVRVTPKLSPVHGNLNICLGSTNILTDTVAGGSWFSINPAIASANSATGGVTGMSVGSTVVVYTLGSGCTVTAPVNVLPLPATYTVTGGGNYCAGGAGVHVGLGGSQTGTNYLLYLGSTARGTYAGTGGGLDFGLQTVPGTYRVVAINTSTTCSITMLGTATVVVDTVTRPGVTIAVSTGDTVCSGASSSFGAVATGSGTAPTFSWSVNGTNVGIGSTYSFVPANGDIVKVVVASSAHCPSPATATDTVKMTVVNHTAPTMSISANPNDSICDGMAVTLNGTTAFGGTSPAFYWYKGRTLLGTGPVFSYIPANGDVVHGVMVSNYFCRTGDTGRSNDIVMKVESPLTPKVTMLTNPGHVIGHSTQFITFTASAVDTGEKASYQWFINSIPVPGATQSKLTRNNFNTAFDDSVSCEVTSSGICAITSHAWVYVEVNPLGLSTTGAAITNVTVLPNPSNGTFTIKGSMGTGNNEEVSLEITNMLGQVVYTGKLMANGGMLDEQIKLKGVANGMYLINLHAESGSKVFHMVVEQ